MAMDRRGFLKGLLTASGAAVAAHLGAPKYMGDELKAELAKSPENIGYLIGHLGRPEAQVGFSDVKVFDNRPVWQSIAGVTGVWAAEVAKKLHRDVDADITRATSMLVQEMDRRLARAEIPEDRKIILEMPEFKKITTDPRGRLQCDMHCGVEEKVGLFGVKEIRVGYLPQEEDHKLVDANGREITWANQRA